MNRCQGSEVRKCCNCFFFCLDWFDIQLYPSDLSLVLIRDGATQGTCNWDVSSVGTLFGVMVC